MLAGSGDGIRELKNYVETNSMNGKSGPEKGEGMLMELEDLFTTQIHRTRRVAWLAKRLYCPIMHSPPQGTKTMMKN